MEFHEELRKARLNLNLKQSEVAKSLGIDTSTYSGYETGKRSPDVEKIKKLTKILNTSADKLLDTEKERVSEKVETLSTEMLFKNFLVSLNMLNNNQDLNDEDYTVISSVMKILDTWFGKKRQEYL